MVLKYAKSHARIARKDAIILCGISPHQASHLLRKLLSEGKLRLVGKGRAATYVRTR